MKETEIQEKRGKKRGKKKGKKKGKTKRSQCQSCMASSSTILLLVFRCFFVFFDNASSSDFRKSQSRDFFVPEKSKKGIHSLNVTSFMSSLHFSVSLFSLYEKERITGNALRLGL